MAGLRYIDGGVKDGRSLAGDTCCFSRTMKLAILTLLQGMNCAMALLCPSTARMDGEEFLLHLIHTLEQARAPYVRLWRTLFRDLKEQADECRTKLTS